MYALMIGLLVLAALLTGVGQVAFKLAAMKGKPFLRKLIDPHFVLGAVCFASCLPLSVIAAREVEFSIMYGLTALNFLFVMAFSRWLLKERVDGRKLAGVALVMLGLLIMAWGKSGH